MYKTLAIILFSILLSSCKTKQTVALQKTEKTESAVEIIKNYSQQAALDFNTLHIKGSTKYGIISPSLDIRIKKDEIILVSIRVPLGGTIIKAIATPEGLGYYNKLENVYYQGNYEFLSNFLGIELQYQSLQNLLLGRILELPENEKTMVTITENLFQLSSRKQGTTKDYFFDPETYRLYKQQITQKSKDRNASIAYSNYRTEQDLLLPYNILIQSIIEKNKNEFRIDYKSVEKNTTISFPYQIPDGYKEIEIN